MPSQPRPKGRLWRILLLLPILAVLAVPIFNRTSPPLWGFPFFYWYQMLWVILCSGVAGLVFLLEPRGGPSEDER